MKHTLQTIEAAQKRWRSRLKRAMTMLDKLEKQRRRMEAKIIREPLEAKVKIKPSDEEYQIERVGHEMVLSRTDLKPEPVNTDIPDFLRRGMAAQAAVEKVIEDGTAALKAEIEDVKRRKTKVRIEKMKAKQRGDLKKMPLSGKAALEFIHNE